MSTLPLPTDTAHVRIESRQYTLLNFDLGEGVARSTMKVAALIICPWVALLLLLGTPIMPVTWLFLWALPPLLVIGQCVRRDSSGRVGLAAITDAAAFWVLRGRRRIVNAESTLAGDDGDVVDVEFVVLEDLKGARS
ncbi:MAG: hypothetical protein ACK5MR_16890 [Cumulibacter sp.]